MTVRPWVEFSSDLPDDSIEIDGQIFDYGSWNLVNALATILGGLGFRIEYVENLHFAGWRFEARSPDLTLSCRTNSIPPRYVLCLEQTLKGFETNYPTVLTEFNQALVADGRFHDIVWKTRAEMDEPDSAGSPVPVTEDAAQTGTEAKPSKAWWKKPFGLD